MTATAPAARFALHHDGHLYELAARRDGLRTRAVLFCDGEPVAEEVGFGRVLLDLPGGGEVRPTVLVLGLLPGAVGRALLLVPGPEPGAGPGPDARLAKVVKALPERYAWMATAARHRFAPPPGSVAARLAAVERDHPRLWAARHVVLAVAKVGFALLGLAAFVRLLVAPLVEWLLGWLPDIDLPAIPWPDIDLPDIPWPDVDLPDFTAPGWLLVLIGTAKFWGPVVVGVGLAVLEVRRRRRAPERSDR